MSETPANYHAHPDLRSLINDDAFAASFQSMARYRTALLEHVAPAVQGDPVAWMHDSPGRVDVIRAEVKKLLVDSHDAAGHLHRPLDKSEHYTIPLYAAPQRAEQKPSPDVAGLVEALEGVLDGRPLDTEFWDRCEQFIAARRKQQEGET